MNIFGPHSWDWETGYVKALGWEGFFGLPAFDYPNYEDAPDPSVHVMCPVCGKEVKSRDELKMRWDGVLVCKFDWDPRPRNYRRRRVLPERPRTNVGAGVLTFLDETEGR